MLFVAIFHLWTGFSWRHETIATFMGHGTELIFFGIFLFRALSGFGCNVELERPLYAFLAFFLWIGNLKFTWGFLFNPSKKAQYIHDPRGMHFNDFDRIAREDLLVNLDTVFVFFLACCLLAPIATWLCFRYRP